MQASAGPRGASFHLLHGGQPAGLSMCDCSRCVPVTRWAAMTTRTALARPRAKEPTADCSHPPRAIRQRRASLRERTPILKTTRRSALWSLSWPRVDSEGCGVLSCVSCAWYLVSLCVRLPRASTSLVRGSTRELTISCVNDVPPEAS